MSRLLCGPLGALLATLIVLGAFWPADRVQPLSTFDQPFYLGIAQDLRQTGRFTDGYMFADPGPDGTRLSGMRFAPIYPSLLAAVATVDVGLRRGMACQVRTKGHDRSCPRAAPVMRWLQFAMLAGFFTLLWCAAALASGSRRVAWLSLLIASPTAGVLLRSVDTLMTEITALMLITACLTCALAAWQKTAPARPRAALVWLVASGALLGLSILTRPVFLYLFYAVILSALALIAARGVTGSMTFRRRRAAFAGRPLLIARLPDGRPIRIDRAGECAVAQAPILSNRRHLRPDPSTTRPGESTDGVPSGTSPLAGYSQVARPAELPYRAGTISAVAATALFIAATALPIVPWIARNAIVVGHAALTQGYDSHTLVQRISFDSMSWREYALSYVCWLPDGAGLGSTLVSAHACDRFGYDERPDTFYSIGMNQLMAQTLAASGGWERHLGYLLTHYILREPLWHLAVTIPLALRGMWIDHYWGLLLGPCCVGLTIQALSWTWRAHPLASPRRFGLAVTNGRTSTLMLWRDIRYQQGFLLLALPSWFVLVFNAAVAVNQARYNLMLIPSYALSGGLFLDAMLRALAARHIVRALIRSLTRKSGGLGTAMRTLFARLLRNSQKFSSDAPEVPPPVSVSWQHPPLAARASGSARSNAGRRRRDPPAG